MTDTQGQAPIGRRALLGAASLLLTGAGPATTAYDFTMPSIDDGTLHLSDYKGRVLLVVNTASFCGFTPQYKALEALYALKQAAGLTVLGVPSQDFNQEMDSNGKVKAFCKATFNVTFPMAGISHVTGDQALPFYRWVKATRDGWRPRWNFYKVLISRDGKIIDTYSSLTTPDSSRLQKAIEKALKA
jgi:glutathione peroxidase